MKREILTIKRHVSGCCPGNDDFPEDVYKSRTSIHARSRDIKREHRFVRRHVRRDLKLAMPSYLEEAHAI